MSSCNRVRGELAALFGQAWLPAFDVALVAARSKGVCTKKKMTTVLAMKKSIKVKNDM
jgi:hypothetical protein